MLNQPQPTRPKDEHNQDTPLKIYRPEKFEVVSHNRIRLENGEQLEIVVGLPFPVV